MLGRIIGWIVGVGGSTLFALLLVVSAIAGKRVDCNLWAESSFWRQSDVADIRRCLSVFGVNARDKYRATPLHWAAREGQVEVLKILVDAGANVNARNDNGLTPLHWAGWKGQVEVLKILLASGAAVDVRNKDGVTLLHVAARSGQVEALEILLREGIDVNALDKNHWTPLYWGVQGGRVEVIEILLESGAKADVRDIVGKLAIDYLPEELKNSDIYWRLNDAL